MLRPGFWSRRALQEPLNKFVLGVLGVQGLGYIRICLQVPFWLWAFGFQQSADLGHSRVFRGCWDSFWL